MNRFNMSRTSVVWLTGCIFGFSRIASGASLLFLVNLGFAFGSKAVGIPTTNR